MVLEFQGVEEDLWNTSMVLMVASFFRGSGPFRVGYFEFFHDKARFERDICFQHFFSTDFQGLDQFFPGFFLGVHALDARGQVLKC